MFMYVVQLSWDDRLVFAHRQCGKEDGELPTEQIRVCQWANQHCRDKDTDPNTCLLVGLNSQRIHLDFSFF